MKAYQEAYPYISVKTSVKSFPELEAKLANLERENMLLREA